MWHREQVRLGVEVHARRQTWVAHPRHAAAQDLTPPIVRPPVSQVGLRGDRAGVVELRRRRARGVSVPRTWRSGAARVDTQVA